MRPRSMLGTVRLAAGITTAIAMAATGTVWLVRAAVIFPATGVVMLYRVGKSLP
jgi:hypothetical protein